MATKLRGMRSNEQLAEIVGEGKDNIHRYIRLTELIPELLAKVDQGVIALRPAVESDCQLFESICEPTVGAVAFRHDGAALACHGPGDPRRAR